MSARRDEISAKAIDAISPDQIEEAWSRILKPHPNVTFGEDIEIVRSAWLRYGAKTKTNAWAYRQAVADVRAMMAAKAKAPK